MQDTCLGTLLPLPLPFMTDITANMSHLLHHIRVEPIPTIVIKLCRAFEIDRARGFALEP